MVQAFPDTPEQSNEDQPQGPQAAIFHLPLLSIYRIYTGTMSQQHQLSLQGKCVDIIISILTSRNPFMAPRTSLENHWEGKSAHSQLVVWSPRPSVAVCELSVGLAELIHVSVTHAQCLARGFQTSYLLNYHQLILHLRTFRLKHYSPR